MSNQLSYGANDIAETLVAGDAQSFSDYYSHYYLPIFYFAKKFVDSSEQAEDITADSFIKLWQEAKKNDAVKNVKAFLHVTTKNSCLNFLKSHRLRREKMNEITYLEREETRVAWNVAEVKAALLELVYQEIEKLPDQNKEVFKLSFFDGLKINEIAIRLGLSEQTVMNRKSIAMKILRLTLKDESLAVFLLLLLFVVNKF